MSPGRKLKIICHKLPRIWLSIMDALLRTRVITRPTVDFHPRDTDMNNIMELSRAPDLREFLNDWPSDPRKLADTLLHCLEESLAIRPSPRALEESVFRRQGDYWTIHYQGHAAILKATRGLDCLRNLLRHPGREIHVSEL